MTLRIRSPFRFIAAALAAAMIVAAAAMLAPSDARAADGEVSWSVRTASNELGADRTSYSYTVNPGRSVRDGLVVVNRGTEPLELAVYAADGFTTDTGQFDVLAGGEDSVGIGEWVRLERDRVRIGAGKSVTVPFTIAVPQNATPGDRGGGIVTSLRQVDDVAGVNMDRRLGIRVSLRVSGDLAPALTVDDARMMWRGGLNPFTGGDAELTYTLRNAGNTVVSARDEAEVSGPFGWFGVKAAGATQVPDLLPGESWTQHVRIRGVAPLLLLTGTATVTPVVTDASGTTGALSPETVSATGWAVPWTLLAALIVLALAVLVVRRLTLRHRRTRQAREDARVQEAVARALAEGDGMPAPASRPREPAEASS